MESSWKRTGETFRTVFQKGVVTLAANITDFVVRATTDLGKTTRRALPPGNGAEKTHTELWWLCRASSSVSLRSGFICGKVGLDRGDVDVALFFSICREGVGDEDLRDIGAGRTAWDSVFSGPVGGWTFPFEDTGISEVVVCSKLTTSGWVSSWGQTGSEINGAGRSGISPYLSSIDSHQDTLRGWTN